MKGIGRKGLSLRNKSIQGKYRCWMAFSQNAKMPENLQKKCINVKDAFKKIDTLFRGRIT